MTTYQRPAPPAKAAWLVANLLTGVVGATASASAGACHGVLIRPPWAPPAWLRLAWHQGAMACSVPTSDAFGVAHTTSDDNSTVAISAARKVEGWPWPQQRVTPLFKYLASYAATASALLVIDMIWLGVIARPMYRAGIGHLMAESPHLGAAGAFYLMYPIGLMVFAVLPTASALAPFVGATSPWASAVVAGALFGLFAYATYDLTNLATLKNWPLQLSLIDIAWGMFASALATAAGRWALDRLS